MVHRGPTLLQRVLHRSGVVAALRTLWREDDAGLRDKFDRREKHLAVSLKEQIRQTADIAGNRDDVTRLEARLTARCSELEQELRLLRRVLELNTAHRARGRTLDFDLDAVAAHVAAAVARPTMRERPMPHLVVEDLLPPQVHRAVLDAIPPAMFFTQKDPIKQNIRITRKGVLPDQTVTTFAFLEQDVIARALVPALLDRFRPHIERVYQQRYGRELGPTVAALPHLATAGRLMLRRPGYHLGPHLDPRRVLVTSLLYLARPGDSEAYGTTLYRMHDTPRIERSNTYYPGTHGIDCTPVASVPFRSNSALIFLNHGGAHGADIPQSAPAATERYAYQFYVSPEADTLAALVGEDSGGASDDDYQGPTTEGQQRQ